MLHFLFFFVILCMTCFSEINTNKKLTTAHHIDVVEIFDSVSGLNFYFPDTPLYQRSKTGDLNSYSFTYSEPGISYIIVIEKTKSPDKVEESLRRSFNDVLDNRSVVLEKNYEVLPLPHLKGLIHGRYELFVHFQSFYYKDFLILQMITNLGSKKEKETVESFFSTINKL